MAPEKDSKVAREEFDVAYYTRELGRSLQRKVAQRRLAELGDAGAHGAGHADEHVGHESIGQPPREDRAG